MRGCALIFVILYGVTSFGNQETGSDSNKFSKLPKIFGYKNFLRSNSIVGESAFEIPSLEAANHSEDSSEETGHEDLQFHINLSNIDSNNTASFIQNNRLRKFIDNL